MAKKKLDPAAETALKDDYYDGMRQQKRTAGLSLEMALEVTTAQIAQDAANGASPWLTETETPEETPTA